MNRRLAIALGIVSLGAALSLFGCGDDSTTSPCPADRTTVTVAADSVANLCPMQTAGDGEFGGNGPDVYVRARLVAKTPNQIVLEVTFSATETAPDFSAAAATWEFEVATIPIGRQFDGWIDPNDADAGYEDTDHAVDLPPPSTTFVSRFALVGDTLGNDIGACTMDDCRIVQIKYNATRFYTKRSCP